jgi:hypothetical protein
MGFDDAWAKFNAVRRGEIIWNMRTRQWEPRLSTQPISWRERIGGHWGNPPDPPPQGPQEPSYNAPGGLTPNQVQRIEQLNDLARRGIISDAVKDEGVRQIMSETYR